MEFCELKEKDYQIFQMQHPYCNFLNGIETIELEKKAGFSCVYVGVKENNVIVAATSLVKMPMMKKFFYYYSPRGMLVDYKNEDILTYFVTELKSYAKRKGIVYIVCDPYVLYKQRDIDGEIVENGFDNEDVVKNLKKVGWQHKGFSVGYGKNMQGIRYMYSLNLQEKNEDKLFYDFHQQAKRSITKALKSHIRVRDLTYEELPILDDILAHTSERKQFDSRSLEFYQNQFKSYQDKIKVWVAYLDVNSFLDDLAQQKKEVLQQMDELQIKLLDNPEHKKYGKKKNMLEETYNAILKKETESTVLKKEYGSMVIMSAGVFLLYGEELTYLYGGNYRYFKSYNASYALQWYAIREALNRDFKKYNFYGISGDFENIQHDGVYQFKRNFSGQVEELIGDFILPVREGLYKLYTNLKKQI